MPTPFAFAPDILLDLYKQSCESLLQDFDSTQLSDESASNALYALEASAVYSSNIEGNTVDINSFMNMRLRGEMQKSRDISEIEDLIQAISYAKETALTEENFKHAHKIASKTVLTVERQGVYRSDKIGVFGSDGLIYLAVEGEHVAEEMVKFFALLHTLLQKELFVVEVFYYASFLHLSFVHIHPFADGNGRMARLLEKWFLAAHLGEGVWNIASEKYYKERIKWDGGIGKAGFVSGHTRYTEGASEQGQYN